jgi:PEP-CTERM motif
MKKTLLTAIICGMMVAGTAFSQHTQSLQFIPSGSIFNQNDTFTVDTLLTFAGYSAYGLSYWLEIPTAQSSFFHITHEDFFVFNQGNTTFPNEFDAPLGDGFNATHYDLGAGNQPLVAVPHGTYLISHISFSITGAAPGVYTFFTTTGNPRASIVEDTDFNDNPIPQASFSITIVPEPSTFALLVLVGAGLGLLAYRRSRTTATFLSRATR